MVSFALGRWRRNGMCTSSLSKFVCLSREVGSMQTIETGNGTSQSTTHRMCADGHVFSWSLRITIVEPFLATQFERVSAWSFRSGIAWGGEDESSWLRTFNQPQSSQRNPVVLYYTLIFHSVLLDRGTPSEGEKYPEVTDGGIRNENKARLMHPMSLCTLQTHTYLLIKNTLQSCPLRLSRMSVHSLFATLKGS